MKQSHHALSLAPDVNSWLADSRHPRILHIFDRACNLINEDGEVLSIVTPQIGNGPFNLVMKDETCFSEHLRLESEVYTSPTQLHLGNMTIHTATVKLWDPCPDWEKLQARKGDIFHQLTQLPITNYLNFAGFDIPLGEPSRLLDRQGLPTTQSLVSNLSSSLAAADLPSSLIAAQKLAGLGIGLTPAGDDYIMGAIYAAWIIHPSAVASVLANEIAETAAPLTTSLSAAWLRSAGRGEVGSLWHEFFDALISVGRISNPTYLQEAMDKILAVGETSGADALAGFIGVFLSWGEKASPSHG